MTQTPFDYQRFCCLLFSLFTISITDINSKTSTHWIFNEIKEQIVPIGRCNDDRNEHYRNNDQTVRHQSENCSNCCNKHSKTSNHNNNKSDNNNNEINFSKNSSKKNNFDYLSQKIMQIINGNSRIYYDNGTWELKHKSKDVFDKLTDNNQSVDLLLLLDKNNEHSTDGQFNNSVDIIKPHVYKITAHPSTVTKNSHSNRNVDSPVVEIVKDKPLSGYNQNVQSLITCYPYANQTQYDHLNGIYNRETYKFYPEPEVALIFTKSSQKQYNIKINLENVEAQLSEAKAKRPNSPNVYNNIGNLLRVHGQSREAVECFRCALRLSPHHPDALLNLARVLYNQHYLEDAIYLTRHSLETQPRNQNPWLQHFTLGEILRSTGHKQEAQYHFMHALELNPGFRPAKDYLQELSSKSNPITTVYSFCITIFLLSLVFYVLFLNLELNDGENENPKGHRHFNRGMAMKTLRNMNSKHRTKRIA